MFSNEVGIKSGDIVACGASVFVVQATSDVDVTLLKMESLQGARHRADVIPEHWADLAQSGLPMQDFVVRCVPLKRNGSNNLTRLGKIPETLQSRIQVALKREALVRRFENSAAVQSNLMASTASCGRRVGAVRYN